MVRQVKSIGPNTLEHVVVIASFKIENVHIVFPYINAYDWCDAYSWGDCTFYILLQSDFYLSFYISVFCILYVLLDFYE